MASHRIYRTGGLTVFWQPEKCIHSTICVRSLPDVFKPSRRPWVDLSLAGIEQIMETIDRCPSRALTYEINDSGLSGTDNSSLSAKSRTQDANAPSGDPSCGC